MQNITEVEIAGTVVKFYTVMGTRWVFAGCRTAGGYKTLEDAKVEAEAQLTGKYLGPLSVAPLAAPRASAKFARTVLAPLWAKR